MKKLTEEIRVHVFIDASNLWQAQKAKGSMFDYEKLKAFLKNKFTARVGNLQSKPARRYNA